MKLISSLVFAASSLISLSSSALTVADFNGSAASATFAARVIKVDAGTRYVNVQRGDIVTFTNGAASVTWSFDGIAQTVPLAAIFPAAASGDAVVYVGTAPQS